MEDGVDGGFIVVTSFLMLRRRRRRVDHFIYLFFRLEEGGAEDMIKFL